MARQFFNVDERFENVGDYAWFNVTRRDSSVYCKILAIKFRESHWSFYADEPILGGSEEGLASRYKLLFPILERFTNAWIVDERECISWGMRDAENACRFPGGCHLEIITSHIPLFESNSVSNDDITSCSDSSSDNFAICEDYEKHARYRFMRGYHDHHGSYLNEPTSSFRGHRIGIELEVEFDTENEREEFCDIESNWFYRERDGSLGSYGCEIITIPLLPKHAKSVDFWNPLTSYLGGKAKSWDTGRCGLHVHMGREILGRDEEDQSETIGKLLYLYHHYVKDTRLNIRIFGRERGYNDQDGKTDVGNAAKILGSSVLASKDIQERVKSSMISKSNGDRYFDINLRNSKTIEFRKGKGSINPKRIAMVVEYCEILCKYAKSTPWKQIGYEDFVSYLKVTTKNDSLKDILVSY